MAVSSHLLPLQNAGSSRAVRETSGAERHDVFGLRRRIAHLIELPAVRAEERANGAVRGDARRATSFVNIAGSGARAHTGPAATATASTATGLAVTAAGVAACAAICGSCLASAVQVSVPEPVSCWSMTEPETSGFALVGINVKPLPDAQYEYLASVSPVVSSSLLDCVAPFGRRWFDETKSAGLLTVLSSNAVGRRARRGRVAVGLEKPGEAVATNRSR